MKLARECRVRFSRNAPDLGMKRMNFLSSSAHSLHPFHTPCGDLPVSYLYPLSIPRLPYLHVPVCAVSIARLDLFDQRLGQLEPTLFERSQPSRASQSPQRVQIPVLDPLRLGLRLYGRRGGLARGPGSVLKKGGR